MIIMYFTCPKKIQLLQKNRLTYNFVLKQFTISKNRMERDINSFRIACLENEGPRVRASTASLRCGS